MPNTQFTYHADLPGRLALAEQEIYAVYGERVSVWEKRKSLVKFGLNPSISSTQAECVWSIGGDETMLTTNGITHVSSSSGSDVGQILVIEYHTISGSGADAQFTFGRQFVTLNGQTSVELDVPCARVSRMYNTSLTDLVGDVYVHEGGATTGGVPNDITTAHCSIPAGEQQSFKAQTTFSNEDYFIMTHLTGSVRKAQSAAADFFVQIAGPGMSFRSTYNFTAVQGTTEITGEPYLIIPKNHDIKIRADVSANNVQVAASFSGFIAKVTS